MDGERGKTRSEGDEDGRSGRMERRNREATVMDWSVSMKSERGLEDQREEAATCWPPSLILNETLLIRANPSAGPPGSRGRSRHTDHSVRFNSVSLNMSLRASTFRRKMVPFEGKLR